MHAPLYPHHANERDGSKGRRKDARRNVRSSLGTSADNAPGLLAALDAADSLRRIIDLASNGRYGLAIVRSTFEGETPQERFIERFTFDAGPGVRFIESELERSSQVFESVSETRRREKELRRLARERAGGEYL